MVLLQKKIMSCTDTEVSQILKNINIIQKKKLILDKPIPVHKSIMLSKEVLCLEYVNLFSVLKSY